MLKSINILKDSFMPKKLLSANHQKLLKLSWDFQIPPKIVAQALNISYPLVTLYYRGFKSLRPIHSSNQAISISAQHLNTTGQLSATQILATLIQSLQSSPLPTLAEANKVINDFLYND